MEQVVPVEADPLVGHELMVNKKLKFLFLLLSLVIKIVTNPLTNENQFSDFTLSSIEEGGALSAFGVDYAWRFR